MGPALAADDRRESAVRRLTEGRTRWRVLVESWRESDAFRGRLLFQPDDPADERARLESAALLEGRSHEEVVGHAHDLGEDRLKQVLHSLG
jgi:hypothetical protein